MENGRTPNRTAILYYGRMVQACRVWPLEGQAAWEWCNTYLAEEFRNRSLDSSSSEPEGGA
jgi:CRISPR/Cas system-associated protein Cas7 (RAMP superfamily)